MDEKAYERLAADTFRAITDLFEDVDPDLADMESAGDVIRVDFADGKCVVINTQRPARQIWMAGGQRAWHFSYDTAASSWRDDKDPTAELLTTLAGLVKAHSGVELAC